MLEYRVSNLPAIYSDAVREIFGIRKMSHPSAIPSSLNTQSDFALA
jgi:hypothetical protein